MLSWTKGRVHSYFMKQIKKLIKEMTFKVPKYFKYRLADSLFDQGKIMKYNLLKKWKTAKQMY